jgi:putative ABC transport system ATP-binding protein
MTSIASADRLYKFHGTGAQQTAVLRNLSLEVREGEFACVMGPSGSGKSTLLHLLSGLDEPSAGEVHLGGQDLAKLSQSERTLLRRRTIGYVFQFFNLLPNLTVWENVSLPLAIAGEHPAGKREHVQGLLDRFGLTDRAQAFPHQLSGGQMQRASICRALCGNQPLLLCDEPTGNLSQKAGRDVMETLRRVCDEDGRTVLLVTHNPRDASFADRLLFLVDGEIVSGRELTGPHIPVEEIHEALAAQQI